MLSEELRMRAERRARALRSRVMARIARNLWRAAVRARRRVEQGWQQDVERSQMRRLSDRMLRDIGLRRADIDGLFRNA